MSADDTEGPNGDAASEPSRASSSDVDGAEAEIELEEAPALRSLLQRALATPDDDAAQAERNAVLLTSVQRKLRARSKGKFYGDGWSTTASRLNYTLVAAVMLVIVLAVYLALGPTGFSLR